jgi:hypothetical protein
MNSSEFTARDIGEFANNREGCGPHQLRKRCGFQQCFPTNSRHSRGFCRKPVGRAPTDGKNLAQKVFLSAALKVVINHNR